MQLVFRCKKMGWDEELVPVCFDANVFTVEEATNQFERIEKWTSKNNHYVPYKVFVYNGETYYDIYYLGKFEDDDIPQTREDLIYRFNR